MPPFNQALYNKHLRNEKTAKLLEYEIVEGKGGMKKRKFNYMSGVPKDYFDSIKKEFEKNGISFYDIIDNQEAAKLPMFKKELKEMLKGEIEMPIHEFFALIKILGFQLNLVRKDNFHSYEWQSGQEDRLIIRRDVYPKFYVNLDPENLKDFEYVFLEKTKKPMTKTKMMKLLLIAIHSYFKANGGVTPFNKKYSRKKFVEDFNKKYYTNQIIQK